MSTLKIYVSTGSDGGTAVRYYRAIAPWSVLREYVGHQIELTIGPLNDVAVQEKDVIWSVRPNSLSELHILSKAKGAGIPVICDVDDNLFDIPPTCGDIFDHYHKRGHHKVSERGMLDAKQELIYHKRALDLADLITVPTRRLAETLTRYLTGTPHFRVLPNFILRGDWDWISPMENKSIEELTIGWFGHVYHAHDLMWVAQVLDEVTQRYDARFILMGQPEATTLFPETLAQRTMVENIVPFQNFGQIRKLLTTIDVGICPLMDIRFNRGKSYLKALQFGAAGVVPVCSSVVYDQVPELVELGVCANDRDEFAGILSTMLGDEDQRDAASASWQDTVMNKYCHENIVDEHPNAMQWVKTAKEVANDG